MKHISRLAFLVLGTFSFMVAHTMAQESAMDPERIRNIVILDETAVLNLGLETALADERSFETTVFAVGRIEEIPARRYSLSSRIPGRAVELLAFEGDKVSRGQLVARVESRQPGDPPPVIELHAPVDGMVVASHVLAGKPVEPDMDLMDIADRSEMWAVARIPERDAAQMKPGTRARIRIPASGGEVIETTLLRFGVEADREAGTVLGVFAMPNPDGRLVPGMRAEFSIIVAARDGVLSVPREAVQGDPARRVVYVKDFELPNAYLKVPVVLGESNDRYVEVVRGLWLGDEVVTKGSYSLGFVGGGGGISLKEALDAAHGHAHNEDGSEISAEGAVSHNDHDHHGASSGWLVAYTVGMTALALVLAFRRARPAKGIAPC